MLTELIDCEYYAEVKPQQSHHPLTMIAFSLTRICHLPNFLQYEICNQGYVLFVVYILRAALL